MLLVADPLTLTYIFLSRRRVTMFYVYENIIKYNFSGTVMKRLHRSEHTLKASQAALNRKRGNNNECNFHDVKPILLEKFLSYTE